MTGATHTCTKSTTEPSSVVISTALAPAFLATSVWPSTASTSGAALSTRRLGIDEPAISADTSGEKRAPIASGASGWRREHAASPSAH